jgi:hypothetical protein
MRVEDDPARAGLHHRECPGADPAPAAGFTGHVQRHRQPGMPEHGEERRVWQRELDAHGPSVQRPDLRHHARRAAKQPRGDHGSGGSEGVAGEDLALEAGRHMLGGERRAVVESDAVAEPERPGEPVPGHRPLDGEAGLHVAAAVAILQQRVEDLARHHRRRPVHRDRGIEHGGKTGETHPEDRALPLTARHARPREEKRKQEHEPRAAPRHVPVIRPKSEGRDRVVGSLRQSWAIQWQRVANLGAPRSGVPRCAGTSRRNI